MDNKSITKLPKSNFQITDKETLEKEVELIAKTFGWSRDEILSLPALRRKSYMELIQTPRIEK